MIPIPCIATVFMTCVVLMFCPGFKENNLFANKYLHSNFFMLIFVYNKNKEKRDMTRESITIKKTHKGVWMKKFDEYEKTFTRISKKEAVECINNARERGDMFSDGNENSTSYEVFGYWN